MVDGCPGWSESSLGIKVILLVLSIVFSSDSSCYSIPANMTLTKWLQRGCIWLHVSDNVSFGRSSFCHITLPSIYKINKPVPWNLPLKTLTRFVCSHFFKYMYATGATFLGIGLFSRVDNFSMKRGFFQRSTTFPEKRKNHLLLFNRISLKRHSENAITFQREVIMSKSVSLIILQAASLPLRLTYSLLIWAASWQNQHTDICTQWSLRSAWASAQSDQSLHCALSGYLRTQAFFMRTVKTLIRLGWCQADLSLHWAHMPLCWFCHKAGHISFLCILFHVSICVWLDLPVQNWIFVPTML